jgi:hypothetical protein
LDSGYILTAYAFVTAKIGGQVRFISHSPTRFSPLYFKCFEKISPDGDGRRGFIPPPERGSSGHERLRSCKILNGGFVLAITPV